MSPLKPQHTYSVMPGPGRPAECRVTVLEARVTVCGDLSYQDARALGYRTSGEAKAAWVCQHDKAWIKRELIDLADAFDDTCSVVDWLLVKRFDTHWAHKLVQVVSVKRIVDEPRFLADQRRSNAGSYTRSAARAIDFIECVSESDQERLSRKAAEESDRSRRGRAQQRKQTASADWARRNAERGAALAARRVEAA